MISLLLALFSAKLAAAYLDCYNSATRWSNDSTPVCNLYCASSDGTVTTYDLSTDDTNFGVIRQYAYDARLADCAWTDLTFGTAIAGQYCYPRCTCATAGTTSWKSTTYYDRDVCAKCTCYDAGTYNYEQCYGVVWEDRWSSTTNDCPPASCTIGTDTIYVGQNHQFVTDSTGACQWCECTAQDTYTCYGSSDWATAKTNENFKDNCYYELKGCWDDTSKWEFPNYCGCPKCGCDPTSYTAGYVKSNSGNIGNDYECNHCTCTTSSSMSSGGYENCDEIASSYIDFDCSANLPKCKRGSQGNLGSGSTDSCVPGSEDYCAAHQFWFPRYDRDTGYSSDSNDIPYYNCELNFVCDGFNAENQCAKGVYDLTLYTYDCETGVSSPQQVQGTSYFQCCDNSAGDGSCFADDFVLDKDNCPLSQAMTDFYTSFITCQYGSPDLFETAFGRSLFCDEDTSQEISDMTQTEKCTKITELLNSQYKCYCEAMGIIYPNIDTEANRNALSVWWTNFVASVSDHYNTEFGDCDIDFKCDLPTGGVTSTVVVTTVEFTMSFPTTLTAAEVKSIVAVTLGVPESYITVTISSRRRLQTTQTATIKIEFTGNDATKAAASN